MKSQNYISNFKCACADKRKHCNCPRKNDANAIFLANIKDIATALHDVMVICGIYQRKAESAIDVVIDVFLYYDEIYHRVNSIPLKRLRKEDLIHDLGRKCLMNRMEAQLAYTIVKRAFKAFYYGTGEGGIRNPIFEAQLMHTQECLWVHAAKRTAQIFASYEGMFLSTQKTYESQIRCVYKKLFDRLQKSFNLLELTNCTCKDYRKDNIQGLIAVPSVYSMHNKGDKTQKCYLFKKSSFTTSNSECTKSNETNRKKNKKKPLNISINRPRRVKCNCPRLICDCEGDCNARILSTECSQGPFKCQWLRIDEEEPTDKFIDIPEDHECPTVCDETSVCIAECECDCGECCECSAEGISSDTDDDAGLENDEEEQMVEEESDHEPIPVDMTDINERVPNLKFDGCRVPQEHTRIKEVPKSNLINEEIVQPVDNAMIFDQPKENLPLPDTLSGTPKHELAPKDQLVPKHELAPKDQLVPNEQLVPKDQLVPKHEIAPKDQLAPKDPLAPKDQLVPKHELAPKGQLASEDQRERSEEIKNILDQLI